MKHSGITRRILPLLLATLLFAGCDKPVELPQPAPEPLMEQRIEAMGSEHRALYERYIEPYAGYGLFLEQFNNGFYEAPIGEAILDYIGLSTLAELAEKYGDKLPAAEVEGVLGPLFGQTSEWLREQTGGLFDGQAEVYLFTRAADATPYYYEVVTASSGSEEVGDWLTIYADGYNIAGDALAYRHILTFEMTATGPVLLINSTTVMGYDGTPPAEFSSESVRLYIYDPATGAYSHEPYIASEGETYGDLAVAVAERLGIEAPGYNSIRTDKSQLTLDFSQDYLSAALTDAATELGFLNSLAMTYMQNCYISDIIYTAGGTGYASAALSYAVDERFPTAPLNLGEYTEAEYAAMRAQVPYSTREFLEHFKANDDAAPIKGDETSYKLADQLLLIGYAFGEAEAVNAAEIPNQYKLERALDLAEIVEGLYRDSAVYYEGLEPICIAVQDSSVTLKEHVEEAVRQIFGPDATVEHESVGKWIYHPIAGVYTPPHMGGGAVDRAAVFSYTRDGDTLTAEVAYYFEGMGGYLDEDFNGLAEADLVGYLQTRAQRYIATFTVGAEGELIIQSIIKK